MTVLGLLAAAVVLAPSAGFAQEKKKKEKDQSIEKKEEGKAKGKRDRLPAGGKVGAIDKEAKTLKVGERVFHITSETRIMKAGKPATLADGVVGEEVGISYKKEGEKLTALSVRFGPRPEGEKKKKKKED